MYSYPYPRPSVTVDIIVIRPSGNKKQVLLIERANEPFAGKWALPGGFMDMNETLLLAARRELKEETGLDIEHLRQFGIYDSVGRDPRGRTLSVVFWDEANSGTTAFAGDDAANVAWFFIDELPGLAFDHDQILADFNRMVLTKLC